MGGRDSRRNTQRRRRGAARPASFYAPSPDDLGLRPLPTADGDATGSRALLIAAISQELRTPLNAIIGYAHLLAASGPPFTPQQRDDLRQLQASASRLARAIDGIIELARMGSGRIDLAIESTDLIALAAEAQRRAIDMNGAAEQIALVHDEEPLCADVDPMRLLDVLVAVVRLLRRLSPRQPLGITVRREGADAVVVVAAEPEPAAGTSGRRSGRRPAASLPWGGPALDIAVAARLAELLGGSVAVEADPDAGSRFIMRLPLTPTAASALGSRRISE